jgi:hypothetical protein
MTGFDGDLSRPRVGVPTFLVYRECPCGNWLCTGEGASAPACAACGGRFMPGGGPPGMYGDPRDDGIQSRRRRSLAFVGILTNEAGAVRLVHRIRGFLGLYGGPQYEPTLASDRASEPTSRYFGEDEQRGSSDLVAIPEPAR